ncbi:MAG: LysM peptidoglycan-binding domain-containing protein [Verrucomicrobiota bacterium]|nr:LysM peptidoglycan-binding domain-containing protein [Verrucomicrobiota bacterium]
MNASNPFQIPACLQRAEFLERRRERFKRCVIATFAIMGLLLTGLLIEGCKSERAAGAKPGIQYGSLSSEAGTGAGLLAQGPARAPSPAPVVVSNSAPRPVSKTNTAAIPSSSPTVYVVKSGDTLTKIARRHRTTVGAIESANGLTTDRILVGAKLKIPAV